MSAPHTTYAVALAQAARKLEDSPTPALDARVLMMAASGLTHADLIVGGDDAIPEAVAVRFEAFVARRADSEPVAHITGGQEFFGRMFRVTADTLIPRPETEMLIESALEATGPAPSVLDLGTGTGCLLLTLLAERPEAKGVAVELSAPALAIARENAARLGVEDRATFLEADFANAPEDVFDLILTNPPYIEEGAPLPRSVVQYEPAMALRAGADGLDAYRVLAPVIAARLAPGGNAFLEIGTGQGQAVRSLMKEAMPGRTVQVHFDLAGHERMVAVG